MSAQKTRTTQAYRKIALGLLLTAVTGWTGSLRADSAADLAALFAADPGDTRGTFKAAGLNFGGEAAEYTLKYNDGPNNSSDFHMIRVAEVMLNKAEALVELNGSVDATAIRLARFESGYLGRVRLP